MSCEVRPRHHQMISTAVDSGVLRRLRATLRGSARRTVRVPPKLCSFRTRPVAVVKPEAVGWRPAGMCRSLASSDYVVSLTVDCSCGGKFSSLMVMDMQRPISDY